ncbi:MAG: CIA30 family protein, partial [Acidobacteriota bacterium]
TIKIGLPFKFPVTVRIIRDGKLFLEKKYSPMSAAEVPLSTPGVYRCEIFAGKGKFTGLPWIVTNPFFIGTGQQSLPVDKVSSIRKKIFEDKMPFKIEKNDLSSGEISYSLSEDGSDKANMRFNLRGKPAEKDYWVSLASRGNLNLTGFKNITFETRSSEELVFWLELRSGEGAEEYWYRYSFKSGTDWNHISIPFDKFYQISKNTEKRKIDLSSINSIFFSINNSMITIPEISGKLEIRDLTVIK